MKFERIYLLCCLPCHLLHLVFVFIVSFLLLETIKYGGRLMSGWTGETLATTQEMTIMILFVFYGIYVKWSLFNTATKTKFRLYFPWILNIVYLFCWMGFWSYFAANSDMTRYTQIVVLAFAALTVLCIISFTRIIYLWKQTPTKRILSSGL